MSGRGLIVAAPRSGAGKTVITLALLAALKQRGIAVRAAKVGPDYIDPGFHAAATGQAGWVLLETGAGDGGRFAPLGESQVRGGQLVLAVTAQMISDAPTPALDSSGRLPAAGAETLARYYSRSATDLSQGAGDQAAGGGLVVSEERLHVGTERVVSGRARLVPRIRGLRIRRAMLVDILKVGMVSCFSPLQSVLTVSIFTHMLARFGTEILAGYGIGARLEFMLTSVAFAFGIASVPMIGMAIGAGRVARARRIAWTAGCVSFVAVGVVATVIAIFPDLWVNIFTGDAGVRAAAKGSSP